MVSARVSSAEEKPDLAHQVAALQDYCQRHGYQPNEWSEEIGSGLNSQRKHFHRLMEPIELGPVRRLIIAHQDRLVRVGFEWFAAFCARHGTELLIVNADTLSPLVHDLLAIVHVFIPPRYALPSYTQLIRD